MFVRETPSSISVPSAHKQKCLPMLWSLFVGCSLSALSNGFLHHSMTELLNYDGKVKAACIVIVLDFLFFTENIVILLDFYFLQRILNKRNLNIIESWLKHPILRRIKVLFLQMVFVYLLKLFYRIICLGKYIFCTTKKP